MRSHLSHATKAIHAISHAINAISDESKKSDTYHTCDITSLIPRPHLLLGVRRIGDLNGATRAALAPLLGNDDAAVDSDGDGNGDGDVNDVARPVSTLRPSTRRTGMPPSPGAMRQWQRVQLMRVEVIFSKYLLLFA
jgi:hypothetical protein